VILIFCLKYFRKVSILLIPIIAGLAMGTVYGRYHYVSDLPAGAIVGISMTWLTMKYLDRHMGKPDTQMKTEEKMSYVS
jgi:membrane-associated phospholipid phosphatase